MPAEMFHTVPYGLHLQQLRCIEQQVKAAGIQIGGRQIIQDLAVGRHIPLVHLHDPGKNIPILRLRKTLHGLQTGEGLETEFRQIAEPEFAVFGKGLISMPHIPIVGIPPVFIPGIVKIPAR